MRRIVLVTLLCGIQAASATVFINEVFINPPGSLDSSREFIELMGTPGKKLDGYAIAVIAGGQQKDYALGSITAANKPEFPEIDEFFSLDGLALGDNGILVIGPGSAVNYPLVLPDSNFQQWSAIWNGLLDTPGNMQNDGSLTLMLVRNRPGATQADPANPAGLRWGKDISPDDQLFTPFETTPGVFVDRYGDGAIDQGEANGFGGNALNLRGSGDASLGNDLEIVDEVSYEGDQGWEYEIDDRQVDLGSPVSGLPQRKVHALDDPQGFNPDCLTRVDYRTKGAGWLPAPGAVGALANGNNWQDTATEQWIRGESVIASGGEGPAPQIFFSNAANANPDAIQPFETNVPLWLNDGAGVEYSFVGSTYQIMPGRINPLAIAVIPGDADRDGDCDADDITKLRTVFGDADWIFSNSYAAAPQGDSGDPATQTRPWDVDMTGDNGVEPSDLQWVLNFQGNTNGQIVGRTYDSTTPAAAGVFLNPSAGTTVQLSVSAFVPSGNALSALQIGDVVDVTVRAQVIAGANQTPGQQNGVMQFLQDATLSTPGVAQAASASPSAAFQTTRAGLQTPLGNNGDLGLQNLNGFATSFIAGLSGPADLYTVTLVMTSVGQTSFSVTPPSEPRYLASTPQGLKLGHTADNGDPAALIAAPALLLTVIGGSSCPADVDGDGVVNQLDLNLLLASFGLCPQDPGYIPAANVDPLDPCVNQTDLNVVLASFNTSCP